MSKSGTGVLEDSSLVDVAQLQGWDFLMPAAAHKSQSSQRVGSHPGASPVGTRPSGYANAEAVEGRMSEGTGARKLEGRMSVAVAPVSDQHGTRSLKSIYTNSRSTALAAVNW